MIPNTKPTKSDLMDLLQVMTQGFDSVDATDIDRHEKRLEKALYNAICYALDWEDLPYSDTDVKKLIESFLTVNNYR